MQPKQYISDVLRTEIFSKGLKPALIQFSKIREQGVEKYNTNEDEINELGYDLLSLDNLDAAVEVFKINVELHPSSSNACDSLGEAYYISGDFSEALKYYRKSVSLDPKNTNAINMIGTINDLTDQL